MAEKKVTLRKPKGGNYTIWYSHPVQKDKNGKALRVHKGLGTNDELEAKKRAEQLEKIINNIYWWDISKRREAAEIFDDVIVDAFYNPMLNNKDAGQKILDKIYLPWNEDEYTKIALVGVSGAGKTTLMKQIIGIENENFPAVSSGRTTVSNMEFITTDKDTFEASIVFMTRDELVMYIQENIIEAVKYCMGENIKLGRLLKKLLEHKDLTFRLKYTLGYISSDFLDLDINKIEEIEEIEELKPIIEKIKDIASRLKENKINLDEIEYELDDDICNEIIKLVLQRFKNLDGDRLDLNGNIVPVDEESWVYGWYYKTKNRKTFIDTMQMFSSNSKEKWGKLLTPIVKTIRIKGNFEPRFIEDKKNLKLVLFDGQGLGHNTSMSSIPSDICDYFNKADYSLLVDNAQQPVMENTKIAIRELIENGKGRNIRFIYTHMDMVQGDNIIEDIDKRMHVSEALESNLYEMKEQNNFICSDYVIENMIKECYFFYGLNEDSNNAKEMLRLFKNIEENKENDNKDDISNIQLKYNNIDLFFTIRNATDRFREEWENILGIENTNKEKKIHWSKIKALSSRLAKNVNDNYNDGELAPLADLRSILISEINIFINQPIKKIDILNNRELKKEDEKRISKKQDKIKDEIGGELIEYINNSMWKDISQLNRWKEAYNFRGLDSTKLRAYKINEIFDFSAPKKIEDFTKDQNDIQKNYIKNIESIINDVLDKNGCILTIVR